MTIVVERDGDGWHRQIGSWGSAPGEVDPRAEVREACRLWDAVLEAGMPVEGVRARAARSARLLERGGVVVRQRWTTSTLTARIHADDGTFVVVRRSIAHDIGPFQRAREVDDEIVAFADDVARVRRGTGQEVGGTVLLPGAAAGTLLHEAVGHLREADNAARFGRADAEPRLGLAVVDVGELPGSDHPRLDDRLQPMRPAVVLGDDDPRRPLLGVEDAPGDEPPKVARARRSHPGVPHLPRMTHLVARATTTPRIDDPDWDLAVEDVVAAFVDLPGRRATLHLGASLLRRGARVRRAHGGRVDLDLAALGAVVVGASGPVETEVAMCDKRGQRVPVATTSPGLLLKGVRVDAVVV